MIYKLGEARINCVYGRIMRTHILYKLQWLSRPDLVKKFDSTMPFDNQILYCILIVSLFEKRSLDHMVDFERGSRDVGNQPRGI